MNEEELRHYGILGMKWGMRRAAKRGEVFDHRSRKTKRLEEHIKRQKSLVRKPDFEAQKRLNRDKYRLAISKERDNARLEYAKKTSAGKHLVQTASLGLYASMVYRRLRAAGEPRVTAALTAALTNFNPVLGVALYSVKERKQLAKRLKKQ